MSVLFVPLFVAAALSADGPSVYRENCAACHGKEGHGDGPTAAELKYKPRDFREGKFAFGNTPGAMVKTVMSGIPGEETARMPAFKSVLAAEEIDAVVQYVRTMMPVEPAPTPTDMKLEPRDGPLMVRGILPGLKEGEPPLARGLLVGLPSGFSFEYGTKPLRLLAVRRGEFVSRTDWEERGGRPLTPLGSVVFATAQAPLWSPFVVNENPDPNGPPSYKPLSAQLRTTSVVGGIPVLLYELVDDHGRVRARVREEPRDVAVSDGAGIGQAFAITAPAPTILSVSLAITCDPGLLPFDENDWRTEQTRSWTLIRNSATSTIAVCFRLPERGRTMTWSNGALAGVDASIDAGPQPVTLKRIVIARGPTTTREQLEKMNAETKELR
jgi:cytochrome c5